jgi:hypothetical protein
MTASRSSPRHADYDRTPSDGIVRPILQPCSQRLGVIFALAPLVVLGGCMGRLSPGEEFDMGQEPAGHVIPAHKPKGFPEAVHKLRALNQQLDIEVSQGKSPALLDEKALAIARDIAMWLPEIAADSDMPEEPWNEINAGSQALVSDYEKLRAAAASNDRHPGAGAVLKDAAGKISALKALLARADARWFEQDKRK